MPSLLEKEGKKQTNAIMNIQNKEKHKNCTEENEGQDECELHLM